MSANEHQHMVFEAIKGGAEEYLVKPVTRKEVQNIWQYVWKRITAVQQATARLEVGRDACCQHLQFVELLKQAQFELRNGC